MTLQDNSGMEKQSPMVLDLSNFVKEVDRFSRLIEPFALIFYAIDDIRRWRFFKTTIALWLLCNVLCIFFTQGAVFVIASTVVIGIATLSLFQVHTKILTKLLPSNKLAVPSLVDNADRGAFDTVQNFRYSLIEVHDFVVKSNEYLNYFYSILRWDSVGPSALYHSEACVFLLSLVVCPARWNCFLFVNWFFLCHPHLLKRCYKYVIESTASGKITLSKPSDIESTKENKSSAYEKEKDNCEIDEEEEDSDLDLTDDVGEKSMIALDPSPIKPGMVARFMEIKKRRKQIANDSCLSCNISFTSILKKRLYCRHCGYSFCNRCCYRKVPRSVFGATSPAAAKETVVVCCSCHDLLVGQPNTGRSECTASQESNDINSQVLAPS